MQHRRHSHVEKTKGWAAALDGRVNLLVLCDLARLLSGRSRFVHSLVDNHLSCLNFAALTDLGCDPSWGYHDYSIARQVEALFKKNASLDLGIDREAAAWSKFEAAELQCLETNERLRNMRSQPAGCDCLNPLWIASRKIAHILGDVPRLEDLDLTFGPGSNTNCRRKTSARYKLSSRPDCSTNLLQLLPELLSELPALSSLHSVSETEETFSVSVDVVPGKLSFVPKDAKILRSIVVEPSLNSMVQRGIGSLLKRKLARNDIDLYDQTRNQRLARIGSLNGSLATIDLSSASDTLSRELVYELLPLDWAIFLNYSRTAAVEYKGNLIHLEKWSSMGNGYTFELESMIFYALAFGVCRDLGLPTRDVSVYGDDIIIPVEAYDRLVEVLDFCGFTVNSAKSFKSGPFRESCGKDYLSGIDVRPVYVKDILTYADLYRLHNFFYSQYDDESCELVLKYIPSHLRLYGPAEEKYGHGHLWSRDFRKEPYKRARGWGGFVFSTYTLIPSKCYRPLPGDRILPVYAIYAFGGAEDVDHHVIRGSRGYKRTSIYSLTP